MSKTTLSQSQTFVSQPEYKNKYKDYWEALEISKKDKEKRLFLLFTASWCGPCQKFKHEVLFEKTLWKALNDNCIIYFLDIDKEKGVAQSFKQYKIWQGSVPTSFVFSNDGKYVLGSLIGYKNKKDFVEWYNKSVKLEKNIENR